MTQIMTAPPQGDGQERWELFITIIILLDVTAYLAPVV